MSELKKKVQVEREGEGEGQRERGGGREREGERERGREGEGGRERERERERVLCAVPVCDCWSHFFSFFLLRWHHYSSSISFIMIINFLKLCMYVCHRINYFFFFFFEFMVLVVLRNTCIPNCTTYKRFTDLKLHKLFFHCSFKIDNVLMYNCFCESNICSMRSCNA